MYILQFSTMSDEERQAAEEKMINDVFKLFATII